MRYSTADLEAVIPVPRYYALRVTVLCCVDVAPAFPIAHRRDLGLPQVQRAC
jgi:hypothetical protein